MTQPIELKSLCNSVLERNKQRNNSATKAENTRNFCPEKQCEKLHEVAHKKTGATDAQPTAEIWVLGWSPAGNAWWNLAKNAEHAEFILRTNPPPKVMPISDKETPETEREAPVRVFCHNCKLSHGPDKCGEWWQSKPHTCASFQPKGGKA